MSSSDGASSSRGRGTTEQPPSGATVPTRFASGTQKAVRRRVLIADDEAALARSLARLLGTAGYEVVTVPDGAAAVEVLKVQAFDVVLSDIQMPGINGVELLKLVREHDLDVPVILMTADPSVETAAQAVELGALQYLMKPIPMEVLFAAMDRATKLSHVARIKRETMRMLGTLEMEVGDRAGLTASFERALDSLWMAFQPIVDPQTGRAFGYEALLRNDEPALPHPGAVIGAAERLGRLWDLGRRIRAACANAFAAAPSGPLLFVNLHTRDLLDPTLTLQDSPLSRIATRVVLEITERSAVDDIKDLRARVSSLRAMGFRIAIDDLGAGYAGLASFALLEPEFVKMDMSLVRNVHTSAIKQKLIGSMSALCKDMGMSVVAEGIETIDERDTLLRLGCDHLQGYLFAKPTNAFVEPGWP